jgi:hypothetical protein
MSIEFKYSTCDEAAKVGDLEELIKLHQAGYTWSKNTTHVASEYGHLNCLRYLRENGCPWDMFAFAIASLSCHLECIKYCFENSLVYAGLAIDAAKRGRLDIIKYAHSKNYFLGGIAISYTAFYGHLECLKYMFENGGKWDKYTPQLSAKNGYLDCLSYSIENGCDWDESTPKVAAKYSHLECFKYCFQHWSTPQSFWEINFDLTNLINKIDLDDLWWRNNLFHLRLSIHPILETKVEEKKRIIEESKIGVKNVLENILPLDIIQYCIYHYI